MQSNLNWKVDYTLRIAFLGFLLAVGLLFVTRPEKFDKGVSAGLVSMGMLVLIPLARPILAEFLPLLTLASFIGLIAARIACAGCMTGDALEVFANYAGLAAVGLLVAISFGWRSVGAAVLVMLALLGQAVLLVVSPKLCPACLMLTATLIASSLALEEVHRSMWCDLKSIRASFVATGLVLMVSVLAGGKNLAISDEPPVQVKGEMAALFLAPGSSVRDGWAFLSRLGCSACDDARSWIKENSAPIREIQVCEGNERGCWQLKHAPSRVPVLIRVERGKITHFQEGFSAQGWATLLKGTGDMPSP